MNRVAYFSVQISLMKRTIALERRMICYPPHRFIKMIVGKSNRTGESKSQVIEAAIRHFFSSLSTSEQEEYMRIYDGLTPEQRKYPNSI